MSLQERFQIIIAEQGCKQKTFASAIRVSESYVSNIINGKRTVLSCSLAALIEEIYGYSAQWIVSGEEPKYARVPQSSSAVTRDRIIEDIRAMSDAELNAVLAFIRSLDNVKDSFKDGK